MDVYTWTDELGNKANRVFFTEKDCQLDVLEWRRFGYKPIGEEITCTPHTVDLPPSENIIQYLAAWFMNKHVNEISAKDINEIIGIYIILQSKIPTLEHPRKLNLGEFLHNLNQSIIDEKMIENDQHDYLLDLFIDCYNYYEEMVEKC